MNFKVILEDVFDEGTREYEIIKECYDIISKTAPTLSSEARNKLALLDRSRIDLSTIYFMLCRNISKKKSIYQSTYDAQYARLVKLGRPSHAAMEAELRATNPEYAGLSVEIEKLEQVKELISSYVKCIDSSKRTALEVLNDSRRLD